MQLLMNEKIIALKLNRTFTINCGKIGIQIIAYYFLTGKRGPQIIISVIPYLHSEVTWKIHHHSYNTLNAMLSFWKVWRQYCTYIYFYYCSITYCNFILYCACRLINVKVWNCIGIKHGIYEFSAMKGKTEYYIFQKKKKKIYRCRLIIGIIDTFL